MYILGIDGGGTAVKLALATEDGSVVARATGGPANLQVNGLDGVISAILDVYNQVAQSEIDPSQIRRVVAGISGAGRVCEQELIAKRLTTHFPMSQASVFTDAYLAMLGGLGGKPGVAIISGTGSIAIGKDQDGNVYRAGGWGYLAGDEGSAFAIGCSILQLAFQSFDGRIPPEKEVEQAVLTQFAVQSMEDAIPHLYQQPLNRGAIAALAFAGAKIALTGNRACQEIYRRAGFELGKLALAVISNLVLDKSTPTVVYCGGTFSLGELLILPMKSFIHEHLPNARVEPSLLPPVGGAIVCGLGKDCDRKVLARIRRTLKP